MCCPAGFYSMLVQVLYCLGSVHPEKLRSCWTPQKPSAFGCGNKQAPGWQIHACNRFLPVGQICFHLCYSLVRTPLYPSCSNLRVAPLCSCCSEIIRPDDSKDTKWTRIPNHFHERYMQFMNHMAFMFHRRDDLIQKKSQGGLVECFQPSYAYSGCRVIGQSRIL